MMETTAKRVLIAPLALSIAVTIAGCSGTEPSAGAASTTTPVVPSSGRSTASSAPATTGIEQKSNSPTGNGTAPANADTTALGLKAILTAESAAGGKAYQIDDRDDDKTWEVDVKVNSASIEVTVSGDGTQVYSQEGTGIDDDLEVPLSTATVSLSQVIQIAIEQAGGTLRQVELEDATDAKPAHWVVALNTDHTSDTKVHVSMTGDIFQVEK